MKVSAYPLFAASNSGMTVLAAMVPFKRRIKISKS